MDRVPDRYRRKDRVYPQPILHHETQGYKETQREGDVLVFATVFSFETKRLFKPIVSRPKYTPEFLVPSIYIFDELKPKKKGKSDTFTCGVHSRKPYDIVPLIRPIILIGPSYKQYEVTKILQQAVVMNIASAMEKVLVCEIKSNLEDFNENELLKVLHKNPRFTGKILDEVIMIFDLCQTNNLLIITGEQINEPSKITPIFDPIYILIGLNNEPVRRSRSATTAARFTDQHKWSR